MTPRIARLDSRSISASLLAAEWEALTEAEREEAMESAREEGQRTARRYLSPGVRSLRRSRWAREHGNLDRLPDDVLYLYAAGQTVACEHHYVEHVIEPHCPERAAWWWGMELEERRRDPRVCCFCDGYERERCRILRIPQPATGTAELELYLWDAREREREQGRRWREIMEATRGSEAAETTRAVEEWEYRRRMLCTDLAEMLLEADTHHLRRKCQIPQVRRNLVFASTFTNQKARAVPFLHRRGFELARSASGRMRVM